MVAFLSDLGTKKPGRDEPGVVSAWLCVDAYADCDAGGDVGSSASLNDSVFCQPSESTSERRSNMSVSLVIGILRAFASW